MDKLYYIVVENGTTFICNGLHDTLFFFDLSKWIWGGELEFDWDGPVMQLSIDEDYNAVLECIKFALDDLGYKPMPDKLLNLL
jgi:hypothetical protein